MVGVHFLHSIYVDFQLGPKFKNPLKYMNRFGNIFLFSAVQCILSNSIFMLINMRRYTPLRSQVTSLNKCKTSVGLSNYKLMLLFFVCEFMQPSFWLSYVPRVSGDKNFDTRIRRHFICHLPLFMKIHYLLYHHVFHF